jgi:hypothetical protein
VKPKLSGNIFLFLCISLLVACGGGGGEGEGEGEGNKGWIEITTPSSKDYFEVEDGNLDLVLGGWTFVSNRTYSDNSNCDNYLDLILSGCEDYLGSDVWVEIINESNDTRTKIPARSGCEQEGCSSGWSWTIILSPGINSILVVAKDSKGNRGTDRISINVVLPSVPVGVAVQAADGSAIASWDEVLGATSYNIYYASSPGVTKTNYSTLPNGNKVTGATSPQSVTGLTNGIPYYFVVTAENEEVESGESLELIATARGVPLGVSIAETTNVSAVVSWNPVLGATSYNIYYASSPSVTKTNYSTLPNGNKVTGATSPQTITGLTIGNDYYFVVTSANSSGESAESSGLNAHIGPTMSFDIKTFRFSWVDEPNATHYRLLENPDGVSGFSQVGSDVPQGTETYDHIVPLYNRINARYILQSCIGVDCTDFGLFYIIDNLVDAIGYFKASNGGGGDLFGRSVSLSDDGNTLAVGADRERSSTSGINTIPDDSAGSAGAVYVFVYDGNNWSQQAYVKASNTDANDLFGYSVSLSGDGNTLAVGAINEGNSTSGINTIPDNLAGSAGAVYVFVYDGSNWSQQAYVKASNTDANDQFGYSVSLSDDGNTLAAGAYLEESSASGINGNQADNSETNAGAVYVFVYDGSDWSQQAYVKASNTDANDLFGNSVSLSGDGNTLAVGATRAGAVYVFSRGGSIWSQQASVKTSNTGYGDEFGYSISLSGDGNTLVVGARYERSSTSGINTIPDSLALYAGAVYVFVYDGSDWNQQAYVKASNTGMADQFGYSVSLSDDGNTLAVGAYLEESSASGINGNQVDSSAYEPGAVYVFIRSFSNWSQQAYVKASNGEMVDRFGNSVSLSGDGNTLAVGALYENSVYLY